MGKEIYILNTHLHSGNSDSKNLLNNLRSLKNNGGIIQAMYDERSREIYQSSKRRDLEILSALDYLHKKILMEIQLFY